MPLPIPPSPMLPPDAGNAQPQHGGASAVPPALELARRIRREQGGKQVQRFLEAMEPFLAPFERQSIAEQMGVSLPARPVPESHASCPAPGRPWRQPPYAAPPPAASPTGGMNSQLLMQLLGQMTGGKGLAGGAGGMNPAMLAQLLGSMNAPR